MGSTDEPKAWRGNVLTAPVLIQGDRTAEFIYLFLFFIYLPVCLSHIRVLCSTSCFSPLQGCVLCVSEVGAAICGYHGDCTEL